MTGFRERQDDVLRTPDREGGDEREPAAVHDLFDFPEERMFRLEPFRMLSARVRRLDEQRVALHGPSAPDQVRGQRVQVPREERGFGAVHLVHRRARDVSGGMRRDLEVPDVDVVAEVDRPEAAPCGPKVAVIERRVESFRVRDLEAVLEQEVCDVRGRRRQHDVEVLAAGNPGDHPGVVEMGVADEHPVHGRRGHRVLRRIARQETVVKEEADRSLLQDHPEAADLRGATEKLEVHLFRGRCAGRL